MPCFSWYEGEIKGDPFVRTSVFSLHPRPDGVLITIHSNMVDNKGKMFNETQSTFSADLEQILKITNLLLLYLQELTDAKNRNQIP